MANILRPASGPPRSRYMIAPRPAASSAIVESIKADPEVTLIKADPKLLIVEMSDSHAKALKERHGAQATFELDAPLTPSRGDQ